MQIGFGEEDHYSTTQNLMFQYMERKALARFAMLVDGYHTRCWWYELLDLCRKLFLNALIMFVGDGSAGQARPE